MIRRLVDTFERCKDSPDCYEDEFAYVAMKDNDDIANEFMDIVADFCARETFQKSYVDFHMKHNFMDTFTIQVNQATQQENLNELIAKTLLNNISNEATMYAKQEAQKHYDACIEIMKEDYKCFVAQGVEERAHDIECASIHTSGEWWRR